MRTSSWKAIFIIGLLSFFSWRSGAVLPIRAASSLPGDLGFECEAYDLDQQEVRCYLKIPAQVLGTQFKIRVPKDPLAQISSIQGDEQLPNSSVFLELGSQSSGQQIDANIAYFALDAEALGLAPYYLLKLNLKLSGVQEDDFPILISSELIQTSEFYTVDSLKGQEEHFRAVEDLPLPIHITLKDETNRPLFIPYSPNKNPQTSTTNNNKEETGTPPIQSTFKIKSSFRVDLEDQGALRGAAEDCFDDDHKVITPEEWAVICRAKSMGIVSGNPRDEGLFFFPHQPINRAEAVKILTLGILRTLGSLSQSDFTDKQKELATNAKPGKALLYPDITYEDDASIPWFAQYVSLAGDQEIATGYPEDNTFRPGNKINNAESYRVIVETGRVASSAIASTLRRVSSRTKALDWFMKYAWTLGEYKLDYSEEYADFTSRKDFLVLVMKLLEAVGELSL